MMNELHAAKLSKLFLEKLKEIYEKNARPDPFSTARIVEFNAWQAFLRESLNLKVVDIEEGESPGLLRIGGKEAAIRVINPSNKAGLSREFIIVPLDLANQCLMLEWVPNKWPPPGE